MKTSILTYIFITAAVITLDQQVKAEDSDPLYYAIDQGDLSRVKRLVTSGVNIEKVKVDGSVKSFGITPKSALAIACAKSKFNIAHYLIDNGADVNGAWTDSALWWIAFQARSPYYNKQRIALIQKMLKKGADPNLMTNKHNGAPLMRAAANNNMQIVTLLLDNGASKSLKNKSGLTAADFAEGAGHIEMANFLRGESNETYRKSLIYAIRKKNLKRVKQLIESKTNEAEKIKFINTKEAKSKRTALHYAARDGSFDIVTYLVENGADINAESLGSFTPLHVASAHRKEKVARYLVLQGAKINIVQSSGCATGFTSLSWAVTNDMYNTVMLMLQKGADVNAPSNNILITARHGGVKMVKLLIDKGKAVPDEMVVDFYRTESAKNDNRYVYYYKRLREIYAYLKTVKTDNNSPVLRSSYKVPDMQKLDSFNEPFNVHEKK